MITILDIDDAADNSVTIQRSGSDNIRVSGADATELELDAANGPAAVTLVSSGTTWRILSSSAF